MSASPRPRPAHAGWTTYQLLDALRRAGYGPLSGREWKGVRAILHGVAARLPYRSGQGKVTVEQVASASGYGLRWTRRCLTVLEDLGLIEWHRGGVQYGRPVPSVIRLVKTMLADLVNSAREQRDAATIAWAAATRQRLAHIRTIRMIRGKRKALPTPPPGRSASARAHAAVGTHPLVQRGDPKGSHPSGRCSAKPASPPARFYEVQDADPAAVRAAMQAARAVLSQIRSRQ